MTTAGAREPKYQRIAEHLRRRIRDGEYAPDQRLPAETELTMQFRVSLPTVRQALSVLRAEGLIESRHGVGTFVKQQHRLLHRRPRNRRHGRARADSLFPTSHLRHEAVSSRREPTPPHIADVLADPPTEIIVHRRVLCDPQTGRVEELSASYVPIEIVSVAFLDDAGATSAPASRGVRGLSGTSDVGAYARDRWVARMPTSAEAGTLGIAAGAAVVHLVRTAEAGDGMILEVSESVWPADRVMILDEYPITTRPEDPATSTEV